VLSLIKFFSLARLPSQSGPYAASNPLFAGHQSPSIERKCSACHQSPGLVRKKFKELQYGIIGVLITGRIDTMIAFWAEFNGPFW
jgi:hypothetical protein